MATLTIPAEASAHEPSASVTTAGNAPPGDTATEAPVTNITTANPRTAARPDDSRRGWRRVDRAVITRTSPDRAAGPEEATGLARGTTGSAAAILDG
jgi:hypothetical protein